MTDRPIDSPFTDAAQFYGFRAPWSGSLALGYGGTLDQLTAHLDRL